MIITVSAITLDNWYHPGTSVFLRVAALSTFVAADGELISGANSPVAWWRDIPCTVGERTDTAGRKIRTLTIPAFTISSTVDSDDPAAKYFAAFWADGGSVQQWGGFESFSIPDTASTQTWAEIRSYNALSSATPPAWVAIIVQNLASDPSSPTPGQIYFNTTAEEFRFWDGTAWRTLGGGGGSGTVTSVSGTAPIQVANGTTTPVVSIAAATSGAAGSMSATDKTKLDAATSANTVSTIVQRDASGNFSAGTITATLNGNASTSTTTTTIPTLSGDVTNTGNNVQIASGVIVNADISASAAIALSKLATDPLARANHTGTQLAATISDFDNQVRTSRLDQMATPTAAVAMGSQRITGVADPSSAQDAATKAYVDANAGSSKVNLQGSTPGTADTGNSNISGVAIAGKVAVGIASPSFGTNNKALFGANPAVAINAATVVVTVTSGSNSGIVFQGAISQTGNAFEAQKTDGSTYFRMGELGTTNQRIRYGASDTPDYFGDEKFLLDLNYNGRVCSVTTFTSDSKIRFFMSVPGAGTGMWFAHSNIGNSWESFTGGIDFKPGGTRRFSVTGNGIDVAGGVVRKGRTITATDSATAADDVILANATSGAVTVNLPAAASNSGLTITVKKIDSSGNAVTIDGNASETIDGATTKVLSSQYETARLYCDGSNWFLI
ncbi:MAG: hypothetical protein K1Y36_10390 [Blastocatellia bacterium]|nr:hypothetical protein [Blastocatellia bacterium]